GDSWGQDSLGIDWEWSGTESARIYVGVDPTYFSGASFTRPILDCQGTSCSRRQSYGNIVWIAGSFTTFDDLEFRGYRQDAGANLVATYGNHNEVERFYIHGWSRTPASSAVGSTALTNNWSGGGGIGTKFHDNVIDGVDDPNRDFMGGILHGDQVYDN